MSAINPGMVILGQPMPSHIGEASPMLPPTQSQMPMPMPMTMPPLPNQNGALPYPSGPPGSFPSAPTGPSEKGVPGAPPSAPPNAFAPNAPSAPDFSESKIYYIVLFKKTISSFRLVISF